MCDIRHWRTIRGAYCTRRVMRGVRADVSMANSHAMWLLLLVLLAMRPAVAAEPAGPVAVQAAEADMRLPAELRASMPARALDQRVPAMERVQVLLDFMIGDDGLALRYREQPTLGIADSYRSREVNCLSFTLMFVAMARAAGSRRPTAA